MGPSVRAGKKLKPSRISTIPTSNPANKKEPVSSVPAVDAERPCIASRPARRMAGMVNR
jgi:hypothetical protein